MYKAREFYVFNGEIFNVDFVSRVRTGTEENYRNQLDMYLCEIEIK